MNFLCFSNISFKELSFIFNLISSFNITPTFDYAFALSGLSSLAFSQYYSTKNGKLIVDSIILRIPLFGDLILRSELASMSDNFATLTNSGLNITEALEKCEISSSNQLIKNSIKKSLC